MDYERSRREEEARREAEERRRLNPRINDETTRRREDPSFDDERYGTREGRSGRRSQTGGGLSRAAGRVAGRVLGRGSGQGSSRGQSQGLYGSQIDSSNIIGSAVAELVGTFILIFTGCAVAVAALLQVSTAGPLFYDSLAVALAFGLALTIVVAAIGHVSGAHVNPAVTLGLAATNKFPWQYVPIYVGAQLAGAILGAIAVWITYGEAGREIASVAATFPVDGVGDIRAFLVEVLVTFILVFVVISVATDDRAPAGVAPLAVGFALACGVLIAGPVTGGSLNPARTLGPMIVAGRFDAVWVYILAPIVGAVLAALVYDRFASQSDATG
ncbi:MAG: Aquaporin Z [uncultured Rubrobacteraceae bacterium]|uniref:Aquaporin Z n=1 Tax=uncultured Rubrobacteraceae bacterium TaxID=349277 RepID=A0A6J4Q4P8_9ACTN|nr:MAG: Aquaporin Z [uncultured Rubrobacteraceae bacterium]